MRQLGLLLSFMWFASVTVVGLVTWTASRATFVPLEELSRQAEAMSGENLSGRLRTVGDIEYDQFAERLNRLLSRLEASAKREERFVADAAHELRTPLTVLRGQIETALMRPRTDAQYRDTLLTLLDESERLSRMVELLLLSTTPKDQEVPPIDLEQVLERAHARWVDRFEPRGVELQLESEPATARILVTEMDVVIDNLLSNALTASPSGTKCTIRVRTEDAQSVVEVQDQGRGIPVELGESIFERFARLDNSRNRGSGGFGIGLAVCRRLVAHRSGKVSLAPSDHGALFVVRLPNGITPSDGARKTPIPAVASTNEK